MLFNLYRFKYTEASGAGFLHFTHIRLHILPAQTTSPLGNSTNPISSLRKSYPSILSSSKALPKASLLIISLI